MNKPLNALILEDSQSDALLLLLELRRGGFQVNHVVVDNADDMKAALHDRKWDIILSDYSMPSFDALAALKIVHEQRLELPFIIISGTVGEDAAVAAMKAGATDFFAKGNLARLVPSVERELRAAAVRRKSGEAEARFTTAFHSSPVGTVISRLSDGQVLDVNTRFLEMYDLSRDNIIGKTDSEYGLKSAQSQQIAQQLRAIGSVRDVEVEYQHPSGSQGYALFSAEIIDLDNERCVLSMIHDITDRKQAEEHIQKLNRIYAVLSDVNQAIVRIRQMPTLFEKVCRIAVEKGDFRMVWIGLIDPATGKVTVVAHDGVGDGYLEQLIISLSDEAQEQHPLASVLRAGEHWICNNIEADPRVGLWREDALRLGHYASAAFPLLISGKVRGIISLYAGQPDFFNTEELKLLDELVLDIAFALEFAEQEEQRQQAEMTVKRYAQRMEILHNIDTGIINATSIPQVVEAALKHIQQIIPCQRVILAVVDSITDEWLVFAIAINSNTELGSGTRVRIPPDWFEGFDAEHIQVIDDFRLLRESHPRIKQLIKEGLVSALQVLLVDRERPIGLLSLGADSTGFFNAEHREIAAEIASQLAIAIRQFHLNEALANHAAQLEQKVTERTAALTEAKERVEAILNNTNDGILLLHTDLAIQQTNAAFNRLFACQSDAYFGKSLITLVDGEHTDRVTETIRSAVAEQQGRSIEIHALRQDGTFFDAELSIGSIQGDGLVASIRDITEHKRAAEALAASEQQLSLLINGVRDHAIYLLDPQGTIVTWNSGAERIKGYSAEEIVGQNFARFYTSESIAQGEPQRVLLMAEQEGSFIEEGWRVRKDGTQFWAEVVITSLRDPQNRLIGFSKLTRDLTEHKRTEDALRASEEKFRLLLDAAPIATVITNPMGQITVVNLQAEALFGYQRNELFGQPVDLLVPELARDRHADHRATYMEAPYVRHTGIGLEVFARRKDGSEFPVEIELSYIETQAGLLVMSFVLDITERKARERQLRYHASLQENVSDAVISTDLDFHIQSWNPAAERIYGWRAEEVIGKLSHDVLQTQSLSGLPRERVIQDFMAIGQWTGEVMQRHRDGRVLNILGSTVLFKDENGLPIGIVAVNHDITERKRAEEVLRKEHDFLELVINTVPGLIIVKDRDGHFQLVNNLLAQIYGVMPMEMVGKTDADFNPNSAEVDFYLQKDREALDAGQSVFIAEETILGRYYQTSKIPLPDQTGHHDRLLVVAADITERKQAEIALRQAFEKEKELSELKSRFVSMASHEFRTPLASILAVSETLSLYRHKMSNEQIEQRLGKIREQVGHLRDIMDDVLQLARLQARRAEFNPVMIDLDALCRSILDEFQSRPELTQRLEYHYNASLRGVKLDKKLMRQIISNLVSNAIKYSPEGKMVIVSLDYAGEALVLKVRDEGIGIPEADLKHLFEPFHRAANVGTIAGTGLGLVIIKESVELHGGTITVESQVDVGTTFIVRIPVLTQGEKGNDENPGD